MTPPSLREHPEAPYPPEALEGAGRGQRRPRARRSTRTVASSTCASTSPAGHGFDEAALAAARQFAFEPARRGGVADPVDGAVHLRVPSAAGAAPPPARRARAQRRCARTGARRRAGRRPAPISRRSSSAQRPISAASSFSVRDRDFQLRPIGSVQDILRVTPGLVMVQHSGGGKANQYFLRGFDADHGTDLALSIDGIPINMVSHAHGQGFADTNFIIPEVVERVEITKGPYFANQGDFATAGAVNMVSRDDFEHSSVGFGVGGSPGHGAPGYRGLAHREPEVRRRRQGDVRRRGRPPERPVRQPGELGQVQALQQAHVRARRRRRSLTLGEMSYARQLARLGADPGARRRAGARSRASDRSIPTRAATPRATSSSCSTSCARPRTASSRALAYVGTYRFNLFSNFTLYLRDPEQRRRDRAGRSPHVLRRQASATASCTSSAACASTRRSARDVRSDDIHEELWNTRAPRAARAACAATTCTRRFVGAFVNEEITPRRVAARSTSAAAPTCSSFAVDNQLATHRPGRARRAASTARISSARRRASIVTPLDGADAQLDVYVNYGHGFHSNDVRGVFATPARHAAHARDRRGGRRARAAASTAGTSPRRSGSSISTARRCGTATTARPSVSDATQPLRASSSRRATRSRRGSRPICDVTFTQVAVQHRRRERRRPRARAEADLVGRPLGAARARPGRRARRPALLRHRRSPRVRRRRARRARLHAVRPARSATATAASTSRSTSRTCSTADFRSAQFATVEPPAHRAGVGARGPGRLHLRQQRPARERARTAAPRTAASTAAKTSTSRRRTRSRCACMATLVPRLRGEHEGPAAAETPARVTMAGCSSPPRSATPSTRRPFARRRRRCASACSTFSASSTTTRGSRCCC